MNVTNKGHYQNKCLILFQKVIQLSLIWPTPKTRLKRVGRSIFCINAILILILMVIITFLNSKYILLQKFGDYARFATRL